MRCSFLPGVRSPPSPTVRRPGIPRVVRTPRIGIISLLDTGCNTGRTTVTADATSITFGHPAVTRIRCRLAATIKSSGSAVVDGPPDYVVFDG